MQYSGLCDVNPDDAVRMGSGETIAQWRKLYFQKFGVRYALSVDVLLPNTHTDILSIYIYIYIYILMYVCIYVYVYFITRSMNEGMVK